MILGCPTTPTKGHIQNDIGGRVAATVEEALASLTTEMVSLFLNIIILNIIYKNFKCSLIIK